MTTRMTISCLLIGLFAGEISAQAKPEKPLKAWNIKTGRRTLDSLEGRKATLSGQSLLTLTDEQTPIKRSEIHLNFEDAWVLLPSLQPSVVHDKFLQYFQVDGQPAKQGENVRLAPFVGGTLVIPHGPDYEALRTYNRVNHRGAARTYVVHKYYKSAELGEDEDKILSFVLKKGYMATFAENENGSGASQVFIARDRDVSIRRLPEKLAGKVSFLRVFPWRWTGKKGFGGREKESEMLGSFWRYGWDAGGESTLDMEYVPMRHNKHWDSWEKINSKQHVTHLLGFNEPMQKDQSHMTMEQCLALWPKLQESGLRLGSPCPTDGTLNWLYEFIDKADQRGHRVDFVSVHYYKGNWSPRQMIDWLRKIHERTGRPIWLTEFNNGASWVKNHNPSMQENAQRIEAFCRAMDATPFVERYAVFNVRDEKYHRQVIQHDKLTLTGQHYRRNPSAEAYVGATRGN
ncbi:MAG: glycoside hydrolase family protein [Pirellulales bacterium]|nr:glycoside hydrolase family protein [Pirellulales bacterium]